MEFDGVKEPQEQKARKKLEKTIKDDKKDD
jgi:hypothetical protein